MNMNEEKNKKPLNVLFGVLAYDNIKEYESYLNRLNEKSALDVLLTISTALKYAQSKGVYSFEESEAISIILRKLNS